ncbi:MAG: hypothetical protein FJ279_24310 [Planctomycetes bacterium]|nr:hypothetical protein [Planctomycetota bacterium]
MPAQPSTIPPQPSAPSRPDNPKPRTENPPSSSINHKPSTIASEPRAWPAAKVLDLLARYEATPEPQRPALLPELAAALKSYRKEWQGTPEAQLEFEGAYRDLGALVKERFSASENVSPGSEIIELCSLRIQVLSDPSFLGKQLAEIRKAVEARDYDQAEPVCRRVVDGYHGRLPNVELVLGACCMYLRKLDDALAFFRGVIELCHQQSPETAARAGFLAANALLYKQQWYDARDMLQALVQDYPGTKTAAGARDLLARRGHRDQGAR